MQENHTCINISLLAHAGFDGGRNVTIDIWWNERIRSTWGCPSNAPIQRTWYVYVSKDFSTHGLFESQITSATGCEYMLISSFGLKYPVAWFYSWTLFFHSLYFVEVSLDRWDRRKSESVRFQRLCSIVWSPCWCSRYNYEVYKFIKTAPYDQDTLTSHNND